MTTNRRLPNFIRSIGLYTFYARAVHIRDNKDSEAKRRSEAERETCKDYQDGKCDKTGDHDGRKQYCKYCWFKRCDKALHQAVDCPFGKTKEK